MPILSADFETASRLNLKQVGAAKYARDPSTVVLCLAYAFDNEEPDIWFPGTPFPARVADHIASGGAVHAWNCAFERVVWNYTLARIELGLPYLLLENCYCTMARGLFWGLPPKLEHASRVATPSTSKDKEGHALMLRMTRPRKIDPDGTVHWWHIEDPERLIRLGEYCKQDVRAERAVALTIPPHPVEERKVWLLDQRMNDAGLYLDQPLVSRMQVLVKAATDRLGRELAKTTGGIITRHTQTKAIREHLNAQGLDIDSLDKRYLPEIMRRDDLTDYERQVLTLYQRGAKASLAKLTAMSHTVGETGRIAGLIQYGGAMRTLRWAGRGVQIQNYPRPIKGLDTNQACDDILAGMPDADFSFLHGETLDVISACLRGCYIPAPGHRFVVCDYSAIEARVVGWLAGQTDLLDLFRRYDRGKRREDDPYVASAAQSGSTDRNLGKVKVLACGYGMGPPKFQATAEGYGLFLSLEACRQHVYSWREHNAHIVTLWYDCDEAVRDVIKSGQTTYRMVGYLGFKMGKNKLAGSLLMRLPSGRHIVYRHARMVEVPLIDRQTRKRVPGQTEWKIAYDGLANGKWQGITTWGGKIVENATQAAARDVLADALIRLDGEAIMLNTTIHDEVVSETETERARPTFERMKEIMAVPPSWGVGLPLEASGNVLTRYGKA